MRHVVKAALSAAFHAADRSVLSRLPPRVRYMAYKLGLRGRALITRDAPAGRAETLFRDLGMRRGNSPVLPPWIVSEIKAIRSEIDPTLYASGLPTPSPYHLAQPSFPARAGYAYPVLRDAVGSATHVVATAMARGPDALLGETHAARIAAEGGTPVLLSTDGGGDPSRMRGTLHRVDMAALFPTLSLDERVALLTRLLVQLRPETLVLAGSELAEECLARHGTAIRSSTDVVMGTPRTKGEAA